MKAILIIFMLIVTVNFTNAQTRTEIFLNRIAAISKISCIIILAASVKTELAKSIVEKADRPVTDGLGESQPVTPNDTPVN